MQNPIKAFGFTETDVERMKEKQEKVYNTGFKTFLMECAKKDPNFLMKFVECATGSNCLPYNNAFKIKIEFNFSLLPDGYPKFHSCTGDIRLPGYHVLFDDYPKFKHDMYLIIDKIYNHFDAE